ncbi:Rgg family transcriptional regulator [Carnobacterium gallinarum]|uniref:Rgg/GadR/MutR family transcriptional regulator n=1 Tax=Carnobacterium gallinarum TaxID=2749 RepID=UPI0005592D92|nr:Rgg/GadR/MutR family transcriptional regulator [Carnobacterium gallinarum]
MKRMPGEVFKEFRISKHETLNSVAKDIVSVSQLSKFERGKNEITLLKFYKLLERINVSIEEFTLSLNLYETDSFIDILKEVRHYYQENNVNKLIFLFKNESFLYKEEGQVSHKLNSICIKQFIYDLEEGSNFYITNNDRIFFKNYLNSVDMWTHYELLLFANSFKILDLKSSVKLSKYMIQNIDIFKSIFQYKKILIEILLNIFLLCIENRDRKLALYYKKIISNFLLIEETLLYEKTIFLFMSGLYIHTILDRKSGVTDMETAISILYKLGSIDLAMNYEGYLKKIIDE